MKRKNIIASILIILAVFASITAQNKGNETAADLTLRGSGRVNASTLGMEFNLPLGSYPGRGVNVPISLNYSSKLWRAEYVHHTPIPGGGYGGCRAVMKLEFSENSASGWTTSLATPYIEYTGMKNIYWENGSGQNNADQCDPQAPPVYHMNAYVRRLLVHLPGGETHELRSDDTVMIYPPSNNCVDNDPNTLCDPNDPSIPENWNLTYYAVDGSNIKYIQNSTANVYRLLLPDGSFYDFDNNAQYGADRKAVRYTDRNGNFTTFHAPDTSYPNGYWTDTLGRVLSVPIGLTTPSSPTTAQNPQIYSMPGMTGTYKLHWKRLKGDTSTESGLTNFSDALKYYGNRYTCNNPYPTFCFRPPGTYLFGGGDEIVWSQQLFNPIVLTKIEMPNGQEYRFTYDVYGRIERIYYPTGGEERFQYAVIPTLNLLEPGTLGEQTNFGVINRKVYQTAGQGIPYEWTYTAVDAVEGYKVSITAPDGVITERFLHWGGNGGDDINGTFGYDDGLAGMVYKEQIFSNTGQLVSKKLTNWTKKSFPVSNAAIADWHPRVTQEESIIYDSLGNGVSATAKYFYDSDFNLRETPLLQSKSEQYAFVTAGSPLPQNPVRTSETTFLINDSTISQATRDVYKNQNMVGLATASVVKDAAGKVVSRSEMKYDESGYSPNVGRGNPTTSRVWDSTKGNSGNPSAYIQTRAKFDAYGNQTEAIDAKGISTVTTFDATYHAFPISVTTAAPDPSGLNGSNVGFTTTATFDPITGLPLTTTDANGLETRIEYDLVTLRPKNTKTFYNNVQVGSMSETIYNDQPNNYWVKSRAQIDANKWAESITYFDGLGRAYKTEEVNSQGNIFVEKEFDEDGRVKRVTNPFRSGETKQWTTNVYDNASRVIEVILPDGAKVKTDYGVSVTGVVGVTKQITDQAGKKRKGISDALGRMVRVIEDPAGQNLSTDYVFDTLGNLRKTIQGEQSRYFTYDSLGRLLYAKQPEQEANASFSFADPITNNASWSVKYEYDDNGNITKTTDARGVFVAGTYDNFNRLKLRDYSDATPDVNFYYDGKGLASVPAFSKGKTTKVTSSVSESRYTSFDNLGRLLQSQQLTTAAQRAGTESPYTSSYTYNLSGALLTETYPSGRVVTNTLDQNGDLESVLGQKANQTAAKLYLNQISYNSAGNIERMRLGNGRWETAVYNERQQIKQIGLGYSANDKSLLKIDYDYGTNLENNGSLREQKINFYGLTNQIVQNYIYDDLNRLKSATETVSSAVSWKQTFNYDRFGNRTFDAANTTTLQGASPKVANPQINTSDNRLKKDQDNDTVNDYDYDKTGSVTLDAQNQRFIYDAENRLKQFFNATNAGTNPDAVYEYDGEGRRVRKINYQEEVIFVYNASGTLVAEYSTKQATTAKASYLTADHLGSPRIITDEGGTVVARHDYTAFGTDVAETLGNLGGRTINQGYGKVDEIRKQYTGYERDDESGLEYAQARYYNASHGRFTSIDPLTASANVKDPQTFNRYTYAMNSPYKFTDPLGLISENTGACGNRCPNSGPTVDGSAFRGTDSSFAQEPNQQQTADAEAPPQPEADQNASTNNTETLSNLKLGDVPVGDVKVTLSKKDAKKLEKYAKEAKEGGEKEKSLFNTARQEILDNIYSSIATVSDVPRTQMIVDLLVNLIALKVDQVIQVGRFIPEMIQIEISADFVVGGKVSIQANERAKEYNSTLAATNSKLDQNRNEFIANTFSKNAVVNYSFSAGVIAKQNVPLVSNTGKAQMSKEVWNRVFDQRVTSQRTNSYK